MTRDEARRRAVEAAYAEVGRGPHQFTSIADHNADAMVSAVCAAYERAIADAGWRMVRVPEELMPPDFPQPEISLGYDAGWNACRAAMLDDEP